MVKGDQSVKAQDDDYRKDSNTLEDMEDYTAATQDKSEDMDEFSWDELTRTIEEAMDELELKGFTWSKEELENYDLY